MVVSCCGIFLNPSRQYSKRQTRGEEIEKCLDEGLEPTYYFRNTNFDIFSSIGAQTWVAGIGGPSMFANMSDQAFADIQAVLFPRYILLNTSTSLLALLGYMKQNPTVSLACPVHAGFGLVLSLATNLINLFVFFPWTHNVLVTYMDLKKDKEADEKAVAKARMNFGIVHGICNIINYITMGANLFFLYKVTGN